MGRAAKVGVGIVIVAGLAFAQVKYDLTAQIANLVHPTATSQTADAQQPAQGAKASGSGQNGRRAGGAVLVKLDQVTKKDFPLIERNYGNMTSPNVVGINARITSQITKVNVKDGQMVKAGDVLVELDDRTLQAQLAKDQATLAKDQAALVNAQTTLERAQMLFSKNAGPKQDVDNAVAAQQAAAKTIDADQAVIDADKIQLDFTKITAPFDGKLGAVSATLGQLVSTSTSSTPTTSLMTITQMQPLKVDFRLPEQVLPALRAEMDANGIIPQDDKKFVVRVYTSGSTDILDSGKLDFVDSTVDQASGTIGLAGEVGNSKLNLWPGQQVNIELEYGTIGGALTVPTVAVQQGQQGPYVWVVDDQNKVKATPIKVSRYEGDVAAIDGLAEGTKIVLEGQAKLADGVEVRLSDAKPRAQDDMAKSSNATQLASPGGAEAATPDTATMKKKDAAKQDTTAGATQP